MGKLAALLSMMALFDDALRAGLISEKRDLDGKNMFERWGFGFPENFFDPYGPHNGCYVAYEEGLHGEKYPYVVVADMNVDPEMVYDLAETMGAWESDYEENFANMVLVLIPGRKNHLGKEEPFLYTKDGLKRALYD
jgi:hypothetical protein